MTTLVFNVLWNGGAAQRGAKSLALSFDKLHGSTVRGMTAAHVAGGLILKGLTAAKNGLLAPINNASKFEASMRLIGVTSGQSGKGLKDLTKLALDMGAKTSFSAQGASDAMLALAKGGMSAAQIKAGALQSTLTLATAGGLELGHAAKYMVQGLTSFGLKAGDAGRVAAALAGGANASTASVETMGLALSQVGAGAKTAGLSLEDTTAALAAFANAGVQGSDAGTSLKTFLQRLIPVSDKAKGAMHDLGLITKEGKNQFFDASGKIKSMTEVSGLLQKALQGQTREQKIATLTTIFGSDASRAAAILADEGAKGLAKYVKATSDKSAAEALAKNATLGYAGALERFKGSVETAGIQVGTKLLPVLAKLLDWMSGKALPALSQLAPAFSVFGSSLGTLGKTVKVVFSSIAAGFGLGKGSFQDFSDFIATHQEDITKGIITGGKAFIGFGIVVARAASAGLRGFGVLADGVGQAVVGIEQSMADVAHAAVLAWGWVPGLGDKLKNAEAELSGFARDARNHVHVVGDAARGLADGIDNKLIPGLHLAGRGLDEMGRKAVNSAHARDVVARAEISHRRALDAATAAAKANGRTMDKNTAQGQANRTALTNLVGTSQSYIQKLINTSASSKTVTARTKDAKEEFIRVATKMGVARDRAVELANKYFKIPKGVKTNVTQPGMSHAIESAKELQHRIDGIKNKSVKLSMQFAANATKAAVQFFKTVPGSQASGFVNSFRAKGGPIQDVSGRGVKGKDTELVGAAVGEHMWTDKEVDAVGGHGAMYRMRSDARAGRFKGYADGGPISRYLRINTSTGKIPSSVGRFGPAGVAAASDIGGDAIRELGADARRALNAAAAAAMGGPGGPIGGKGYAAALAYARRHAGHPYIFGTLWDCSGFISALHSIILGQRPHRRYSTPAFHGAHAAGFTRGKRSPFMVGVNPAPGKFGHMAGTLNGVNVESAGGVGVRVGGRARGYNSGMFSWRGGLAGGGPVRRGMGDLPFDTLDPQGERYNPWLADLVHQAGYRKGGRIGVHGQPERVLSSPQNRAFEHLVSMMDRRGGATVIHNHYTINAPHYVGPEKDLIKVLVDANRRGQLEVTRR